MKEFASRLPLPVTVIAFSWILMGAICDKVVPFIGHICMLIGFLLTVATVMKVILDFKSSIKALNTSVGLSMFSTFSMSLMMISAWMRIFMDRANIYFWTVGIILQTIILLIFTIKYIINFNLKNLYPTLFLVYSGMGISTITCREFGMIVLGRSLYMFTIYTSVILLPIVAFRCIRYKINSYSKPLVSLFLVPISIILPAGMAVLDNISERNIWIMFICIQVMLLVVVITMVIDMLSGFSPNWAYYAASISIGVFSSFSYIHYVHRMGKNTYTIDALVYIELFLSFVVCSIVTFGFLVNTIDHVENTNKIENKISFLTNNKITSFIKFGRSNKTLENVMNRLEEDGKKNIRKKTPKVRKYNNTVSFRDEELDDLID